MPIAIARDCTTEEGAPKRAFPSRGQAFAAAQRLSHDSLVGRLIEYQCRMCGQWHVGHAQKGRRIMATGTVAAFEGISYPVTFRATPGRNADGLQEQGAVMWSADCEITEGIGLTAAGSDPASALAALNGVIVAHTQPFVEGAAD